MPIPIIITTYERPEYFASTIESLINSEADLSEVYIFDDCSKNKEKIKLLEAAGEKFNVIIRDSNRGTVLNTIPAFDYVYERTYSDLMVYVQDDVLFSKNWLNSGLKELRKISEKQFRIAYISLYNRAVDIKNTRIMTGHPGGVCWIINSKFWEWYRANYDNRDSDYMIKNNDANSTRDVVDYKLSLRIRAGGWRIACTGKSYVQHIGDKSSLHDKCMVYCRVNNFVGENA